MAGGKANTCVPVLIMKPKPMINQSKIDRLLLVTGVFPANSPIFELKMS